MSKITEELDRHYIHMYTCRLMMMTTLAHSLALTLSHSRLVYLSSESQDLSSSPLYMTMIYLCLCVCGRASITLIKWLFIILFFYFVSFMHYKKNNAGSYLKKCFCKCEPCRIFFYVFLFINQTHVFHTNAHYFFFLSFFRRFLNEILFSSFIKLKKIVMCHHIRIEL
jgi:hypothetical protein